MNDAEFLTDDEIKAQNAPRKPNAVDEQDLAGLDAEVAARDNALKASLRQSVMVNPDEVAATRALSEFTKIPADVVDRNKEEVTAQARVATIQGVLASSPILARQMTDPEFSKLAHDDAENLSLFEKTLRTYLGASVKSGVESLLGTTAKFVDTMQPFTLSEQDAAVLFKDRPEELRDFQLNNPSMFLGRFARSMQQASEATMQNVNPDARAKYGDLKYATTDLNRAAYLSPIKVVGDAIQSLPTTLALAVSMYVTKGTAQRVEAQALASGMTPDLARQAAMHAGAETMAKLGAATEGAAGFGQQAIQTREQADKISDATLATSPEYQRLLASGYSKEAARVALSAVTSDTAGAVAGVADAATNYYGGQFLGKIIGEGGALLKRIAKGFATEATTEAVQSGIEQLGQNAAVQKFLDHHQELLDGVAENVAQGFVVGGVMGGAFTAAAGAKGAADRAQRDADVLKQLMSIAGADKLRERNPEEFKNFVQAAAEESGTESVFIDAATFAQAAQDKGLDVAATMPETAAQMEEAIALKADVRIPLGELTRALPGTGLENTLLQHMRMSPAAPSLAEIQDKQFVEETQKAVAKAIGEFEFDTAQKSSSLVVEHQLLAQLTAANRFTKDVNEAYAGLMATFYTVQAARLGVTAEELYVKYPLRIVAENVAGKNAMDQTRKFTPEFTKWFGGSKVVDKRGLPLVVYHGTFSSFDAFDTNEGTTEGATFFSVHPKVASAFADPEELGQDPEEVQPNVVPAYLSIKNPLVVDAKEILNDMGDHSFDVMRSVVERARKAGHDGLHIRKVPDGGAVADQYAAFFPEQIKSVFNERPSNDPNILKQDTIDNATGEVLPNPPFYSGLSMQIAAAKMNVAPAAQWKAFINSLSSKGVKKDEITLSGVMDWLDAREKPQEQPKQEALPTGTITSGNMDEIILVNGEKLLDWLTSESGGNLSLLDAVKVGRSIVDARKEARPEQTTNWREAKLALLHEMGRSDTDAMASLSSEEVVMLRALATLKSMDEGRSAFRVESGTPNVPAVVEDKKPAVSTRITKQEVIDYLAMSGVKVQTKILGAPKEEQEDYVPQKPTNTLPAIPAGELPEGFSVVPNGNMVQVFSPDGNTHFAASPTDAVNDAQFYAAALRTLPPLPDDYEYTVDEDGSFEISVPARQGGDISANSRSEAMEAINQHYNDYREDAGPSEPDEDSIEQRAQELAIEDSDEIARDYANNSEYANYSFDVAFRPPNYEVVKVESSRGIKDMFSGEETREHYHVVELTFEKDMPKDDAIVDSDRGDSLTNANMPTTAEDFWDTFEPDEKKPVGPEFATEAEAHTWAAHNVDNARSTPIWILWDAQNYGRSHDPESGGNEGVFDSFEEASTGADGVREGRYEAEIEQMKDEIERDPEQYVDLSRYRRRAEEELTSELESERPDDWYSQRTINSPALNGWRASNAIPPQDKEAKRLALQHSGKYQSDGGQNYREIVIGVPNAEGYNANDTTHFGHVFDGRTIAWARVKEHRATTGENVLFVEEVQSQRAQAGRESGFKRTTPATAEEMAALEEADSAYQKLDAEISEAFDLAHEAGFDQFRSITGLLSDSAIERVPDEKREEFLLYQQGIKELWLKRKAAEQRHTDLARKVEGGNTPSAPFVESTQAWVALTMKRLIRYAVDRGLNRIVWTQGQEQVERYEGALRKAVRTLNWTKTDKGIEFEADGSPVKRNRNDTEGATFTEKELRTVVGPHIAQKVINDPNQSGEISGEDIKINDLWPAGFYGDEHGLNAEGKPSLMTIVANKVSKSLGGGEVSMTPILVNEEGKTYENAPGFEITDRMREAAKKGLPLFQPDKWADEMSAALEGATTQGKNARGQISFGDTIQDNATITLLKNADLSTFLHETGHFYLEVMSDIASQPGAPTEIQGDMQRILNWFGVPDLATWQGMTLEQKRPFHEQFARGFESYLFSGKAPNTELQGLFSRFRAWLINVYRTISALNVDVTDEVRQVFDRMLATNDEIVQAEAARAYTPLFKSAEEMGATAEEWRSYQELGHAATQEAVDLMQTRSLRDMKWLSNAKSRLIKKLQKEAESKRKVIEREITEEVRATPVYSAIRFLTHGELPEHLGVHEELIGKANKLSLPALKAMYGEEPAAPWRYLNTGKYGHVTAEDGLNPSMVAELFGFTSGDHLVREILASEPEANLISGLTDQRMLERYGDLTSPEAVDAAANEAVHNEARGRFLATEVQALAKAVGQRKVLIPAAKEFAATLIARKKIKDIHPGQYVNAETRAAKAAERAKSLVERATEKRNQLVNHYAARAAYDAQDEIEKSVAYLRRVGESKTIDPTYREQILALLDRFELRQRSNKDAARRESLLAWVEDQRAQGLEPVIDNDLLDEMKRMPYREMPLEEFRGLVDAVRNIEHLGRLKHKLLALADQREFAAVVGEATDAIEKNAKRTIKAPIERTKWTKIKSGVAEFFALHRKFSMMMREMDGHADNGVLWKLFVRPMNRAGDTEAVMREAATKKLQALLSPIVKAGRMTEKRYIPEIKESLTREGRIMVALNMGNAGNLQRLLDGDGWSIDQANAILNTLTKQEMDFVQKIWDFIGEYRNEIGAQQKRITGVAPEWVEPRQVQTIHGEYRGGYIPAKYDTTRSTRSLSDEAAQGVMDLWRAKRGAAKARDSFTKERANKVVNRPLRKDFGVITQHVTEVTHRLAWQEYLMDAQRLLRAPKIDKAIRDHYGPEVLKALRDTIEDIAAGEVGAQNAFESGVNYLRTGATIAGLGWRLTTAMLQPIGLTQSMVRIGPRHVAAGLVEWLGDAAKMESTTKKIFEKSDMMRLRSKTMQREISEIRNVVAGKNSAIEASFFYLITKLQLVADIPTWLGQYHKSVEAGVDEKEAVASADQAVLDAQGGGQIKDLAGIQRGGPMLKLFTNFYSFFNTTYNMTSEAVGRAKGPLGIGFLAVDLLLLYTVPAVLGTLMKAALHSGDDGQDDKKLVRQLIADQLTYLFGTMVGLREVAGALQTAAGLPGDYQGPASVRVFAELAKLGKQVNQGEIDEALLKAANNTAGILFHYPAGQIGATVDGIVTMANGKTQNPGALIVGSNKK